MFSSTVSLGKILLSSGTGSWQYLEIQEKCNPLTAYLRSYLFPSIFALFGCLKYLRQTGIMLNET
jgi:hypothetical protein